MSSTSHVSHVEVHTPILTPYSSFTNTCHTESTLNFPSQHGDRKVRSVPSEISALVLPWSVPELVPLQFGQFLYLCSGLALHSRQGNGLLFLFRIGDHHRLGGALNCCNRACCFVLCLVDTSARTFADLLSLKFTAVLGLDHDSEALSRPFPPVFGLFLSARQHRQSHEDEHPTCSEQGTRQLQIRFVVQWTCEYTIHSRTTRLMDVRR